MLGKVKVPNRLPPDHTVVHTIPGKFVAEEERRILAALHAGGYPQADRIDLCVPAMDALEGTLHDVAVGHDIDGYDMAAVINEDGDLEIVTVFSTVSDAMLFKMALPG
jgi:hypothetical protein